MTMKAHVETAQLEFNVGVKYYDVYQFSVRALLNMGLFHHATTENDTRIIWEERGEFSYHLMLTFPMEIPIFRKKPSIHKIFPN